MLPAAVLGVPVPEVADHPTCCNHIPGAAGEWEEAHIAAEQGPTPCIALLGLVFLQHGEVKIEPYEADTRYLIPCATHGNVPCGA